MFRTRREGRLWTAAAVYFGAILATLSSAQTALLWLRERGALRTSLLLLFLAVAVAAGAAVAAGRPGRRETLAVLAIGAVYALLLGRMEILQERLHLVEYGLLAWLLSAALEERGRAVVPASPPWRAPLVAGALNALAGLVDELVQGILPSRVYDLRDVGFNALAGVLALTAVAARRAARARDRARALAPSPPATGG